MLCLTQRSGNRLNVGDIKFDVFKREGKFEIEVNVNGCKVRMRTLNTRVRFYIEAPDEVSVDRCPTPAKENCIEQSA